MVEATNPKPILMAEDDDSDRLFARKALEKAGVPNPLLTVGDGEELLDYLQRKGKYAAGGEAPRPCIILLDLNMPRMDGREALKAIKSDQELRTIPVVVLTTSKSEEDILHCYQAGANSYIAKPVSFDGLLEVMRSLADYWLGTVDLPIGRGG